MREEIFAQKYTKKKMERIYYCCTCEKFHFAQVRDEERRFSECPYCKNFFAIDVGCSKNQYDSMDELAKQNLKREVKTKYTKRYVLEQKTLYDRDVRNREMKAKGILFDYPGSRGKHISVYSNRCVITTEDSSALGVTVMGGEKTIFYKDVIGIKYKCATDSQEGYLYLDTASSKNTANDNLFYYEKNNGMYTNQDIEKIKYFVIGKVSLFKKLPTTEESMNHLTSIATLYDKGLLTREEFEMLKKKIIGM